LPIIIWAAYNIVCTETGERGEFPKYRILATLKNLNSE